MKKYLLLLAALWFAVKLDAQIPDVPDWVGSAVFYQVYPQSFRDSDGDGIGDLEGIIEELDYIKSLGVNAIWINPFYVSPFCDAGYDVADFYDVAPRYGNIETAKRLFEEAHKRNIRIILDFVVGHTSVEHPWFKASCANEPMYRNWYIWTDGTWADAGKYSDKMIQGYCQRDGKFMINFFWCQPKLNYGFKKEDIKYDWQLPEDHPDVLALKAEMKNIMVYWLKMGADGFRVDMAGSAGDALWKDIRGMFNEKYPDAFLISEWGVPATAVKAGFHADFMHWFESYDDLFHKKWFDKTGYSYFDPAGKGDITHFLRIFFSQYDQLKDKGYISIPVDNHDMVRVKSEGRDDRDLEIIYAFEMTFPNLPFVYYGDEIGMRQLNLEKLPAVEGAYGTRAGNRTPMQWNHSKNYGFSKAPVDAIYLPQDSSVDAPTVESQQKNPGSLLNATRKLISLHQNEPALAAYAGIDILYAKKDAYPLVYSRQWQDNKVLVVLNPADRAEDVEIALNCDGKQPVLLMGSGVSLKIRNGYVRVNTQGKSYAIYKY